MLIERILGRIHAETVFDGLLNESLGIDGAVQMIVQVGALGHALQEVAQNKRIVADSFELLHKAAAWISCADSAAAGDARRGTTDAPRQAIAVRRIRKIRIADCLMNTPYPTISAFLKQSAISFFAVSGLSEPCTEFF
jgi:hypothetical protein